MTYQMVDVIAVDLLFSDKVIGDRWRYSRCKVRVISLIEAMGKYNILLVLTLRNSKI